jgi:hypothetical protein
MCIYLVVTLVCATVEVGAVYSQEGLGEADEARPDGLVYLREPSEVGAELTVL